MLIYLLLFTLLILLIVALVIWDGNALSPAVIMCITFMLAVLAAIYNVERWGINLHWNTYFVIAGGVAIFVLVSALVKKVYVNRGSWLNKDNLYRPKEIYIENWKLFILLILVVSIGVLYHVEAIKLVRRHRELTNWMETMYWYRKYTSFGQVDDSIPFLIRQVFFLVGNMGYVFVYITLHNYFATKKVDKRLVFFIAACEVLFLLGSGRADMIRFITVGLAVYEIYYYRINKREIKLNYSFIIKALLGFLIFCMVFVGLKQFVGRREKDNFLYYITFYIGESIANLDSFLQEKREPSNIVGKETFYGLNHLRGVLGDDKYDYIIHKEFRTYNGLTLGNVYTMFRAYINDFGYIGFVFLMILYSFFMNVYYMRMKYIHYLSVDKPDLALTVFGYFMYSVYVAFFADFFYSNLSMTVIKIMITFALCSFFLTRLTISFGGRTVPERVINNDRITEH